MPRSGRATGGTGIIATLLIIWFIIGALGAGRWALGAGQRGYYGSGSANCAKVGTIVVTVLAGPLNYVGVNPKITATRPSPASEQRRNKFVGRSCTSQPRPACGSRTLIVQRDSLDTRGDEEPTVAFLARLAGGRDALELAVGTGRIALPLMAAGVHVDGIELSQDMIDRLHEKPGGATRRWPTAWSARSSPCSPRWS